MGHAVVAQRSFRLKSALVEQLTSRGWSYDEVNLLPGEFGLARLAEGVWNNPSVADILGTTCDSDLTELYSVVFGVSQSEVVEVVESDDPGTWKPGYVRLFMSHSAPHKEFVGKVTNELAVVGIDGFVAHTTMEVNKPWQDQIEASRRSMEAFVAAMGCQLSRRRRSRSETDHSETPHGPGPTSGGFGRPI